MSEAEWDAWDKQIEDDLEAGRFDKLLKEVDDEYKQGLTTSFCEGKRQFYQSDSTVRRNDQK